jgi:hypothetical protein
LEGNPLSTVFDRVLAPDVATISTRMDSVESCQWKYLNGYELTASVDLGLNELVRLNAAGKLIPATDASPDGAAIGVIASPVAAGGKTIVFSTGHTKSDLGLIAPTEGSWIYLGTDGDYSATPTGNGRLIQPVCILIGGLYRFDFRSPGVWVSPL